MSLQDDGPSIKTTLSVIFNEQALTLIRFDPPALMFSDPAIFLTRPWLQFGPI